MSFQKNLLRFNGLLLLLLVLPTGAIGQHYVQANLVSSIPGVGSNPLDVQLLNPWGLSRGPTSPWWVSDNGTGLSTIYNGAGVKQSLVVTIPVPSGVTGSSTPTGVVFNGTADFSVPGSSAPTRFIFVTQEGTVAAWNGGSTAVTVVDRSKEDAIFMGCTIGELNGKHYLYVANFHSGKIEVYDASFHRIKLSGNTFVDNLGNIDNESENGRGTDPREQRNNFAPFNVQAIGTNIYVAYAMQDSDKEDEVAGAGLGFVTVYDTAGNRLGRLQHGDWFNAPWGLAMAPGEFGEFSHSLLVGMFGSGQIAAFNPVDGSFLGLMKDTGDAVLSIEGLWALGFGAGNTNSGPYNTLYFTAGPRDEEDGLFGTLVPIPAELAEADEP